MITSTAQQMPTREEQRRGNVYVVDDDRDVRLSIEFLLESVAFKVLGCSDAEMFFKLYDPEVPACVVLDVRMPGLGGFDLLKKLQEMRPSVTVIMITGFPTFSTAVRAFKSGAVNILEKPIGGQALIDAVTAAIELDRERRDADRRYEVIRTRYRELTPRQREVLVRLLKGYRTRHIAEELQISIRTAEGYRAKVLEHMQVSSVAALVRLMWPVKDEIEQNDFH